MTGNPFKRPPKFQPMFDQPVTDVALVNPLISDSGHAKVVILDRIEPGVTPDYCTHGRTTCYACDEWCWLGDKTYEVVRSGEAAGICLQCARKHVKAEDFIDNVRDHRRKDGPH